MRREVTLSFGRDGDVVIDLPAGTEGWTPEAARRWLDEQFVANDCEPRRASGKVLTVDKLLAIAAAVGRQRFDADAAFGAAYADAAIAALARPAVRIDVEAGTISS
jgi:hypothetical protein